MSDVTWFKVLTDIFADEKIKIIQSMPEGDSLLVMWFKVLSQAGKTNDGGYIYLRKEIPYTAAMLATLFNKQQQLVEVALKVFEQFGMIDIDDNGYIFVTNWERHQNIDKLNQIKEKTNLRVQKHREKKKLELMGCNVTETLHVTQSNATDKDIDKDIDKEKDNSITTRESHLQILNLYCSLHKKFEFNLTVKDREQMMEMAGSGIPLAFVLEIIQKVFESKGGQIHGFGYYSPIIKEAWTTSTSPSISQQVPRYAFKPERRKTVEELMIERGVTYEPRV